MKYTVTNIQPQIDKTTGAQREDNYGNKKYNIFVKDTEGQVTSFNKGFKGQAWTVGQEVEGTLEQAEYNGNSYWKFTAAQTFGGKAPWKPQDESTKYPSFAVSYAKDILCAQLQAGAVIDDPMKYLEDDAKTILNLLKTLSNTPTPTTPAPAPQKPAPAASEDEINIDDIPF